MERDQAVVDEAYRAPVEDHEQESVGQGSGLFVTSTTKLVVLYLTTFGLYGLYWFYAHWQAQKQAFGSKIWPIARGIFSIFFATQLFKSIDVQARQAGHHTTWNPSTNAAVYIVLVVGARLASRFDRSDDPTLLGLVTLAVGLAAVLPVVTAQKVANLAAGDEHGQSNSSLTALNVVAMLLGAAVWALVLIGTFMADPLAVE
jgi:hypothetical protein